MLGRWGISGISHGDLHMPRDMSDEALGPFPLGCERPNAREGVLAVSAISESRVTELLVDRALTQSTRVGYIANGLHIGGFTGTPEHDAIALRQK